MSRRIFIHHEGALGDLLLSLSAIAALGRSGDVIELAGREDVAGLLQKTGFINSGMRSDSRLFLPLFSGEEDKTLR